MLDPAAGEHDADPKGLMFALAMGATVQADAMPAKPLSCSGEAARSGARALGWSLRLDDRRCRRCAGRGGTELAEDFTRKRIQDGPSGEPAIDRAVPKGH